MLSSRARYAARAMLHLSHRYNEGPILIQEIADKQGIPLKYLQQILVGLKTAGLVQSRKGPGGGYALSKAPGKITLGAVVRAMDDSLDDIACLENASNCGCPYPSECALRQTYQRINDMLNQTLDRIEFHGLSEEQLALSGVKNLPDFVI